jgi:hypothetical protein
VTEIEIEIETEIETETPAREKMAIGGTVTAMTMAGTATTVVITSARSKRRRCKHNAGIGACGSFGLFGCEPDELLPRSAGNDNRCALSGPNH